MMKEKSKKNPTEQPRLEDVLKRVSEARKKNNKPKSNNKKRSK